MTTISSSTTLTTAYQVTGDTTGTLVFKTGSSPTTAVTIDGSQNVGIGTSSPSYKLQVKGAVNNASTSIGISDSDGRTLLLESPFSAGISYVGNYATSVPLGFKINGSEVARFDSSGNFGIGTSSPSVKLDIVGEAKVSNGTYGTYLTYSNGNQTGIVGTYGNHGLEFRTNNTERMRIDSSGNVGIGTTPSAWSGMIPAIEIGGYGSAVAAWGSNRNTYLLSNAYYGSGGFTYKTTGGAAYYNASGELSSHKWYIAPSGTAGAAVTFTQAMTLDSSGNLLVGTTSGLSSVTRMTVVGTSLAASFQNPTGGNQTVDIWNQGTSGTRYFMQFNTEASATARGYLTYNGSTVAIAQASDQRLKENIVDAPSALSKIEAIQIRSFDFKEDGRHVDYGVIAQELHEVIPSAVFEGSDSEDGAIDKPWSVGLEPLIPVLVKAIQELNAKVEAQAAEIAALKGQA